MDNCRFSGGQYMFCLPLNVVTYDIYLVFGIHMFEISNATGIQTGIIRDCFNAYYILKYTLPATVEEHFFIER